MKQEDKELVLRYLSMALPYGVVIKITLDFRAFIYCKGCEMFNAESSRFYSMYELGNIKAEALEDVIEKVRPYIKVFGSPIEEEEE